VIAADDRSVFADATGVLLERSQQRWVLLLDCLELSPDGNVVEYASKRPRRVSPTKDVERFVRALPLLVPEGSIAYFEGTGESHVAKSLAQVSIPAQVQVAIGTIWPRPDYYHVPVSQDSMEALATFLEKEPAAYFCTQAGTHFAGSLAATRGGTAKKAAKKR
jgi:hypothetical protein